MNEPKCEACGTIGAKKYVHVRTVNGGLSLCAWCLAQINGKNPETKRLRDALRVISEWDCLNPPATHLCADLKWLRQVVDAALANPAGQPSG
jgi:hypothetical protein